MRHIIKSVSLLLVVLANIAPAGPATAASSQLVTEGRALLFNGGKPTWPGIVAADEKFAAAAAANDPEASLFLAVTRTMVFGLENSGVPGLNSLADILTSLGMVKTGQDDVFLGPPFTPPGSKSNGAFLLPDTTPSGDDLQAFVAGPLLTLVNADLASLATITAPDFKVTLTPEETGDLFPIEIDYSDVLLLKSGLYTLRSLCNLIAAHALPVDCKKINRLLNAGVFQLQRDLLDGSPAFLTLQTGSGPMLTAGRQALIDAVDAGEAAFAFMTSHLPRQTALFTIGSPIDQTEIKEMLFYLKEARNSLAQNRVANIETTVESWLITFPQTDTMDLRITLDSAGTFLSAELSSPHSPVFTCTSWQQNGSVINQRFVADYGNCLETLSVTATSSGSDLTGTFTLTGCFEGSGPITGSRQSSKPNPFSVNFNHFFDNSHPLRGLLPQFTIDDQVKANTLSLPAWQSFLPWLTSSGDLEQMLAIDVFRSVPQAAIAVDGNIGDWRDIPVLIDDTDSPDQPLPAGGDIRSLKVAMDGNFLYWLMEFNDPPVADWIETDLDISAMTGDGGQLGEIFVAAMRDSTDTDWYSIES